MSQDIFKEDDYQLVSHKRGGRPPPNTNTVATIRDFELSPTQQDTLIRRISEAKEEIRNSDIFESVAASLREGLLALNQPKILEIVCFGLGKIGECTISRYQLAFLLCLRDLNAVQDVKVYDPIFTKSERWILQNFDCHILDKNHEGKCRIDNNTTTIFYLPHCPKQLTNNLLYANWGQRLNYCIIIANSFNTVVERSPKTVIAKNAGFIHNILPYVLELAVVNSFKFPEIFNDTAIHVFPWSRLSLIPDDFWVCSEPVYAEEDVEFIRD